MEDLRYPIGRLAFKDGALTPEERASMIDAIAAHPENMRRAVDGLSDEQLDTPYRDDGWTVRQVVHHVVDSHLNAYCRFKLTVTEETPSVRSYEEHLWAELPEAKSAPVEMSLTLLEALHDRWVTFLRALEADDFERVLDYPVLGHIPMDQLLQIYAWHAPHHEAHITGLRERMGW